MNTRMSDTITETVDQARLRMAIKARAEGVAITQDPDGRFYASSVSQPSTRHYVTAFSCDCAGFWHHQHCKHHSALLDFLGWLEPQTDPDPEPPVALPTPCQECGGRGSVACTVSTGRHRWRYGWETCSSCHGEKVAA